MTDSLRSRARVLINGVLRKANLELRTLTADRLEDERLRHLAESGYFDRNIAAAAPRLSSTMRAEVADELRRNGESLEAGWLEEGQFPIENDYFTTPDAQVAYAMIRLLCPRTIIEIGSGYSTRVLRMALTSLGNDSRLVSVDPNARTSVQGIADEVRAMPVESIDAEQLAGSLNANDVLFIDSSHELRFGNDVIHLYTEVIPRLRSGTVVHIHDVFLPFHYPPEWIVDQRWPWTEQYLVLLMLLFSDRFEVLWATAHLQRTWDAFPGLFGKFPLRRGSSLWLRTRAV